MAIRRFFNPHAPGPIGDVTRATVAATLFTGGLGDISNTLDLGASNINAQADLNLSGGGVFRITKVGGQTYFQGLDTDQLNIEAYDNGALLLGTGGGASPVIFSVDRAESARFNAAGHLQLVTDKALLLGNADFFDAPQIRSATTPNNGIIVSDESGLVILQSSGANILWVANGTSAVVKGELIPESHDTYPIGRTDLRWSTIYSVDADFSGSLTKTGGGEFDLSGTSGAFGNARIASNEGAAVVLGTIVAIQRPDSVGFVTFQTGGAQFYYAPILPSYTVGTLPDVSDTARGLIYVSDEIDGPVPAFSDGTNFRRVTDRAIVTTA